MYGFLLSVHILICFATILVVLLQSGKGGGLAGAFGGGGSTIFGGRGAGTVLTRATMILGALFFFTSITLGLMSAPRVSGTNKSLIQEEARRSAGAQPSQTTPGSTLPTSPSGTGQGALPAGGPTPSKTPAPAPAKTPASPAPAGGSR